MGWGGGVSTECLSAVVLWVSSSSPTAQHFLLGSTWPSLSLARKSASPRPANHGSPPHTASPTGAHHHSTLLSSCPLPHLSVLWHKDHFSWKILEFLPVYFLFFWKKSFWLYFFQCVILLFLSTCSGLQNIGCWTSPSLFICRNTLVRGASVCSSCVLNAKRGSILQSIIDCLFVFKWSCFVFDSIL